MKSHERNARHKTTIHRRKIVQLSLALAGLVSWLALPVLAGLSSTTTATTQMSPPTANVWTSHGPEGGAISSIEVDRRDPNIVYAGTPGGVFKSTNAGASWTASNNGLPGGFFGPLVMDSVNTATLYVSLRNPLMGNDGLLFKTTDGGARWSVLDAFPSGNHIYALAIDPVNPTTLYAVSATSIGDRVFKSTDGGARWNDISASFPFADPFQITDLKIDPVNTNILYTWADVSQQRDDGGLFKSTDGGASWSKSKTNIISSRDDVFALAIDPNNTTTVYAGNRSGVFRSTDGGMTWNRFSKGLQSAGVYELEIDPVKSKIIYAGTDEGVFKSANGGKRWAKFNAGIYDPQISVVRMDTSNPNVIYVGTNSRGVFKTASSGASWKESNVGLPGAPIGSLVIDPGNPNVIFADGYKSTNGGASWSASNIRGGALAIDPSNSNIIYAVGRGAVYKSTDGGASSQKADNGLPEDGDFSPLLIAPSNPNTLYLRARSKTEDGLYKSTDGGASWNKSSNGDILGDNLTQLLAVDPGNANTLYGVAQDVSVDCYADFVLSKSTDGGASWSKLNLDLPDNFLDVPANFAVSPSNPNILYASLGNKVSKSTDGGVSWKSSNTGLPEVNTYESAINELIIDRTNPDIIYAGTRRGVVFKSVDGGTSWNPLNNGLPDLFVSALAIDPSGTFLHAATPSGVFDYQVSASCEYALSAASQAFEIGGGTGSVEIMPDSECSWTAVSLADWISFPAGNNAGSGNGRVSYTVAANNRSTHPRTGTLIIGARSFTVTQAAPPVAVTGASVDNDENLFVYGEKFDNGAVILLNGEAIQTTNLSENPNAVLMSKEAGKKIAAGQSVKLQVRNPNGDLSPEFTFTRP